MITKYFKREDLGNRVLTVILELAHEPENEDLRLTAVSNVHVSSCV